MKEGKIFRIPTGQRTVEVLQYAEDMDLIEVYVPEGVEVIRPKAFNGCKNLRVVHLPQSLTHIDMKVFEDCPLEDIYYAGTAPQWDALEISPVRSASIIGARKHFVGEENADAPHDFENAQTEGSGDKAAVLPARRQIDPATLGKDHQPEILARARQLLTEGGDGRLHIIAPGLCMENVLTKSGDMQLIVFPQGSTMLLDTGYMSNWPRVKEFLAGIGLTYLDYMVFSHGHKDHVGNCRAIADLLYGQGGGIGHLWWTGQQFGDIVPDFVESLQGKETEIDQAVLFGREFVIDGVRIQILGPTEEDLQAENSYFEGCNGQSMIMKLTHGQATCLMAGDLYAAQEYVVADRWGETLKAHIVKTNHHGNFTSNSKRWLDAVDGQIYYSCSIDNGNTTLVQDLEARGVAQYATGCQGTLMISATAEGEYEVKTQYERGMQCLQRVN